MNDNVMLWRAVIQQALLDASLRITEPKPNASKWTVHDRLNKIRARDEAIAWLTGNSKDFRDVCELAKICPRQLRQLTKERQQS